MKCDVYLVSNGRELCSIEPVSRRSAHMTTVARQTRGGAVGGHCSLGRVSTRCVGVVSVQSVGGVGVGGASVW